jgi:hypothetical protein
MECFNEEKIKKNQLIYSCTIFCYNISSSRVGMRAKRRRGRVRRASRALAAERRLKRRNAKKKKKKKPPIKQEEEQEQRPDNSNQTTAEELWALGE